MTRIKRASKYGDPRAQAREMQNHERDQNPHGLAPSQVEAMRERFENFVPKLATSQGSVQDIFSGIMPKGYNLSPGAGEGLRHAQMETNRKASGTLSTGSGNSNRGTYSTYERPYQPEFESPDRQQYPVHRILANRYWRLFYKLDPVIGNVIDMYSELPWSDFELTGIDGEVKDTCEYMIEETRLRQHLPYIVREFMVVGEAAPHLFYDRDRKIWSHITLHNPDALEVIDAPFVNMEPVVEFRPDSRLREIVQSGSNNPVLQQIRNSMPEELLMALQSNQNIPLSPLHFTFIPRKLHPYDTRGTSIMSRMWRILMYEDAIFNASIATARRHAGPLKVAKLGDPSIGYVPGADQERKLVEMLAQAELDVNSWLVYHFGINFELVGTTDRIMSIDKHWDLIERVKLIALGVSKAFLHGEVTYASAASGLTIFLQRLKTLRQFIESAWLYPKFFRTISRTNGWVKPTEAELSHRVRVRRALSEIDEDSRWLIPEIQWERSLDSTVDQDRIAAMNALSGLGVTFAESTLYGMAGTSLEDEARQRVQDKVMKEKIFKEHPELMAPPAGDGMGGGGMGGGVPLPPIPPGQFGEGLVPGNGGPLDGLDLPPEPDFGGGGADFPEPGMSAAEDDRGAPSGLWDDTERKGVWDRRAVEDLLDLLDGHKPEDEPWIEAMQDKDVQGAFATGHPDVTWDAIREWLINDDWPVRAITDLEDLLIAYKAIPESYKTALSRGRTHESKLLGMIDNLDDPELLSGNRRRRRRRK